MINKYDWERLQEIINEPVERVGHGAFGEPETYQVTKSPEQILEEIQQVIGVYNVI